MTDRKEDPPMRTVLATLAAAAVIALGLNGATADPSPPVADECLVLEATLDAPSHTLAEATIAAAASPATDRVDVEALATVAEPPPVARILPVLRVRLVDKDALLVPVLPTVSSSTPKARINGPNARGPVIWSL